MTKTEMDFMMRFCEYIRCAHKTGDHDDAIDIILRSANTDQKECALRMFEYCVANALKLDGLLDVLLER